MTDSDGTAPDDTPEERSYAEFLSAADAEFDRYCAERPELADALRRLHAKRGASPASEASGRESSLVDRLAALYGDETVDATRVFPRSEPASPSDDDSIGAPRYRVLREFARGGMGIIFEVLDQDLDRHLAMKVIQAQHDQREAGDTTATSIGLVQRFLREAKITAQLDHPGVVPVYDVGVHHDGCVYFTMRLIEGDDLRDLLPQVADPTSEWTTSRTVDVVLKVCETIAFCHDRGVVHRDLKPANIRVGRYGEVYVMDWGLAKLLDRPDDERPPASVSLDGSPLETLEGQVLGTPAYMAPEQATGEVERVGIPTDVYGIGALLYTLLCGAPPYFDAQETPRSSGVLDSIRSGPPVPLADRVPDESTRLVEICERAMARNPADRYSSVEELARALRDHRELERRALRDADLARADAERSRRVSAFLIGLFEAADPNVGQGTEITAETLLARGADRLTHDFSEDDPMRASLERTLGEIHFQLGNVEEATAHLDRAVALAESASDLSPLDLADAYHSRGNFLAGNQKPIEARADYERALELRSAHLGGDHDSIAETQQELAIVLFQLREAEAAESMVRSALRIRESSPQCSDNDRAKTIHNLGFVLVNTGRLREGTEHLRTALELWRRSLGVHMTTASCLNNLSRNLADLGEHDEAHALATEALEMRRKILGNDHTLVAGTLLNLGNMEADRGLYSSAQQHVREALAIRRRCLPAGHPDTTIAMNNLAVNVEFLGDVEEAEALHREVLALWEDALAPDHRLIATSRHNLGVTLHHTGAMAEGREFLHAALEHRQRIFVPTHLEIAGTLNALACLELDEGQWDLALDHAERALEIRQGQLDPDHAALGISWETLGRIHLGRGELATAREHLERAHALRRSSGARLLALETEVSLAELERAEGEPELARRRCEGALPQLLEQLPETHRFVERARRVLESC